MGTKTEATFLCFRDQSQENVQQDNIKESQEFSNVCTVPTLQRHIC
jgi:hypothetical protein